MSESGRPPGDFGLREGVNRDSILRPMPYRPTERTEERKARAREAILTAAIDQLAEGGYASATVQAVAARAGVATGTVYNHFHSKSHLFAEVFRRASQREVDAFAEVAAHPGWGVSERVAAAVRSEERRVGKECR